MGYGLADHPVIIAARGEFVRTNWTRTSILVLAQRVICALSIGDGNPVRKSNE
jgi:hypothetical protein